MRTTTFVMLSVDEAHLLGRSLPAAAGQPDAEVLVIDNACTDDTASVAARHGARVIALAERCSYAAAVNAGLAEAHQRGGDVVALLNADCVLEPGFVAAALPAFDDPHVGSVAPRLMRAAGVEPEQRLATIDAAGMTIDRRRKNRLVGHDEPPDRHTRPGPAFGGDGAAVLYRRETLAACALDGELLDEDMALWASDVDLAWRAQVLGWRSVYVPEAVAWHVRHYSPSTRSSLGGRDRMLQFRNRYLMIIKNDRARDLLRDLPWIATYELAALAYVLVRERELLAAYAEALRLAPAARRRRRLVQAKRAKTKVPFGLVPGQAAARTAVR